MVQSVQMSSTLPPQADAAVAAQRLARTLEGLRDPTLRVSWTGDQLSRLGAARASDVLTVVLSRVEERDPAHANLLLMASVALYAEERADLRRAIVAVAEIRHQHGLSALLREGAQAAPDQRTSVVPDFGENRTVTLGERKSLARRRDRNLLARVLRDPHPDVIRILLDNPALTEADVVRLCALRPVLPDVLAEVFRHPRWVVRYRIRLALALNPHSPESVAMQLVPHLNEGDRREVARTAQLSERVRAAAQRRPSSALLH